MCFTQVSDSCKDMFQVYGRRGADVETVPVCSHNGLWKEALLPRTLVAAAREALAREADVENAIPTGESHSRAEIAPEAAQGQPRAKSILGGTGPFPSRLRRAAMCSN